MLLSGKNLRKLYKKSSPKTLSVNTFRKLSAETLQKFFLKNTPQAIWDKFSEFLVENTLLKHFPDILSGNSPKMLFEKILETICVCNFHALCDHFPETIGGNSPEILFKNSPKTMRGNSFRILKLSAETPQNFFRKHSKGHTLRKHSSEILESLRSTDYHQSQYRLSQDKIWFFRTSR